MTNPSTQGPYVEARRIGLQRELMFRIEIPHRSALLPYPHGVLSYGWLGQCSPDSEYFRSAPRSRLSAGSETMLIGPILVSHVRARVRYGVLLGIRESLATPRNALQRRRCASAIRARPAFVLGPVDIPP